VSEKMMHICLSDCLSVKSGASGCLDAPPPPPVRSTQKGNEDICVLCVGWAGAGVLSVVSRFPALPVSVGLSLSL